METRKKIQLTDNLLDVLVMMSEGNPGAASVLRDLCQTDDGFTYVLDLDDMNIRGTQIWVAYKDYCGQDLAKLKGLLHTRDKKMVAHINREGVRGNHKWKAVSHGASFNGKRELLDGTSI